MDFFESINNILDRIENNFNNRDETLIEEISREILALQHALPTVETSNNNDVFEQIIQNLCSMRHIITSHHSHMLPSGTMLF